MSTVLEMRNVSAGYSGTPVISDINISINEGEFVGIIGPNGAGKTTLLRTIAGLCRIIKGSVWVEGRNLQQIGHIERAQILSLVPQDIEINIPFSVEEFVMIGRTPFLSRWKTPSPEDYNIVERAMAYTDIVEMKEKIITELSGGEKQRAVLAMTLARDPRIILLDEATCHLDINHRLEIMEIIARQNKEQKVTVLMTAHDLNLASVYCERLILMAGGNIRYDGTPEQVLKEEFLREVYHCPIRVHKDEIDNTITVTPVHRMLYPSRGKGYRLHVIAGGGSGGELMRRLSLCQYTITCGVLNTGDTDADVAHALRIETVREKPFTSISELSYEKAVKLVKESDAVILTGVPFGPANVKNLELLEVAINTGKPVFAMRGIEHRDYTPDKSATKKLNSLAPAKIMFYHDYTELIELLNSRFPGK
jgi:iron complex transport system ATP-binding protein